MERLNTTYSVFKNLHTTYSLAIFYMADVQGMYVAYSATRDFIYVCYIQDPNDIIDFETNLKTSSVGVSCEADAVALSAFPYKCSESSYPVGNKGLFVIGRKLEIPVDESSGVLEWTFDTEVELQGGDGQVDSPGGKFGDYADFSIIHPIYGEIYRFATSVYILGTNTYEISSDLVAALPAGLIFRATYYAVDTDGRKVIMRLRCYK